MAGTMAPDADTSLELAALVQKHEKQLETLGKHLIAGDKEAAVGTLVGLVTGVASGSPTLGVFAKAGVTRAFANTATKRLLTEYRAYEQEKAQERAKETFIGELSSAIEALLGQSVLQLVRVQHNVTDDAFQALGGLRTELADFREQFEQAIPPEERAAVQVELQEVVAGAVGIRVSNSSRQRAFIAHQVVSGPGTVGIKLG